MPQASDSFGSDAAQASGPSFNDGMPETDGRPVEGNTTGGRHTAGNVSGSAGGTHGQQADLTHMPAGDGRSTDLAPSDIVEQVQKLREQLSKEKNSAKSWRFKARCFRASSCLALVASGLAIRRNGQLRERCASLVQEARDQCPTMLATLESQGDSHAEPPDSLELGSTYSYTLIARTMIPTAETLLSPKPPVLSGRAGPRGILGISTFGCFVRNSQLFRDITAKANCAIAF